MKKYSIFLIIAFLSLCLVGCFKKDYSKENINPYFNATILEINKDSILVTPFEGEEILNSSDKFIVSTDVISTIEVPEMKVGTTIRIVYNDNIEETYPAKINNVFAIYLISFKE